MTMQVRDVLKRVRKFHHDLSRLYREHSTDQEDERVKLLLDYMGRHEQNIEAALAKYEHEAAQGLLDTWLQFVTDDRLRSQLSEVELTHEMTAEEVIETSLELDRTLVALYRQLADETSVPHVQELFSNLLALEEEKDHQYA